MASVARVGSILGGTVVRRASGRRIAADGAAAGTVDRPRRRGGARRPALGHNLAMPPAPADVHAVADAGAGRRARAPAGAVRAPAGPVVDGPARRPGRRVQAGPGATRWNCGWSGWPRPRSGSGTPTCTGWTCERTLDPGVVPGRVACSATPPTPSGSPATCQHRADHDRLPAASSASRYLHLMPLLQPREGDSDGGYAVADYRSGPQPISARSTTCARWPRALRAQRASAW